MNKRPSIVPSSIILGFFFFSAEQSSNNARQQEARRRERRREEWRPETKRDEKAVSSSLRLPLIPTPARSPAGPQINHTRTPLTIVDASNAFVRTLPRNGEQSQTSGGIGEHLHLHNPGIHTPARAFRTFLRRHFFSAAV